MKHQQKQPQKQPQQQQNKKTSDILTDFINALNRSLRTPGNESLKDNFS